MFVKTTFLWGYMFRLQCKWRWTKTKKLLIDVVKPNQKFSTMFFCRSLNKYTVHCLQVTCVELRKGPLTVVSLNVVTGNVSPWFHCHWSWERKHSSSVARYFNTYLLSSHHGFKWLTFNTHAYSNNPGKVPEVGWRRRAQQQKPTSNQGAYDLSSLTAPAMLHVCLYHIAEDC